MIKMKLKATKGLFLDREAVKKKADRRNRQFLAWAGASVMKTARRSMRKTKKSAAPGEPPRAHVGLMRKLLLFAMEFSRRTVVIGPVKLNGQDPPGGKTVPELMEKGGTVTRQFGFLGKTRTGRGANAVVTEFLAVNDSSGRPRNVRTGRYVKRRDIKRVVYTSRAKPQRVTYPARPFMEPAQNKIEPKLADFWKDSVR